MRAMKNENPAGIRRRSTAGSEPYRSFPSFCRDVYGRRLYRIALDAGMTCPNRDGTLGRGGCAFCAGGSGDFAVAYSGQRMDISDFTWFHGNARPGDFIGLRDLFEAALSDPMFAGISVATRPDCLGLAGETGASGAGSSGAVQETSGAGSSGAGQETSGAGSSGAGQEGDFRCRQLRGRTGNFRCRRPWIRTGDLRRAYAVDFGQASSRLARRGRRAAPCGA